MITLLTGAPGAGKTLFTVATMLRPLVGTHVTEETDDGPVQWPVKIMTNIRGLLIDHELVDYERMMTWPDWCTPGMVFVIDECQKLFTRRPNGSKVPPHVHELEEHRGKHSVDFILITQHPMLIDGHVQNLVGRHLHARRVAALPLNIIYEWDHCSKSLLYRNTTTKKPWRYDKTAYRLYKSARVHTKQKRSIPTILWFVLLGLLLSAYMFPTLIGRLNAKMHPQQAASRSFSPVPAAYAAPPSSSPALPASSPAMSSSAPVAAAVAASAPAFSGCMAYHGGCRCYDTRGIAVDQAESMCTSIAVHQAYGDPVPIPAPDPLPQQAGPSMVMDVGLARPEPAARHSVLSH